jgi:hypothetical protein
MNVTLSREHAAFIAKYVALTGYTQEEFASWLLADYLRQSSDTSFVEQTIGAMTFKDRKSAERVQAWLIEGVSKDVHLNRIIARLAEAAEAEDRLQRAKDELKQLRAEADDRDRVQADARFAEARRKYPNLSLEQVAAMLDAPEPLFVSETRYVNAVQVNAVEI